MELERERESSKKEIDKYKDMIFLLKKGKSMSKTNLRLVLDSYKNQKLKNMKSNKILLKPI